MSNINVSYSKNSLKNYIANLYQADIKSLYLLNTLLNSIHPTGNATLNGINIKGQLKIFNNGAQFNTCSIKSSGNDLVFNNTNDIIKLSPDNVNISTSVTINNSLTCKKINTPLNSITVPSNKNININTPNNTVVMTPILTTINKDVIVTNLNFNSKIQIKDLSISKANSTLTISHPTNLQFNCKSLTMNNITFFNNTGTLTIPGKLICNTNDNSTNIINSKVNVKTLYITGSYSYKYISISTNSTTGVTVTMHNTWTHTALDDIYNKLVSLNTRLNKLHTEWTFCGKPTNSITNPDFAGSVVGNCTEENRPCRGATWKSSVSRCQYTLTKTGKTECVGNNPGLSINVDRSNPSEPIYILDDYNKKISEFVVPANTYNKPMTNDLISRLSYLSK
jgi:hypothetical protein